MARLHTGPIHSGVAGRTDHLPMEVPEGAYVMPADIISGFGEGNTLAGFRVAKRLPRLFAASFYGTRKPGGGKPYGVTGIPYGGPSAPRAAGGSAPDHLDATEDGDESDVRGVPIVAAGGEHVYGPDEIRMFGNGDLQQGHRILDWFVPAYRAMLVQKLKKLPGPRKD